MEHTNRERGLFGRTNERRSGETICVTRIEGERMRTNERATKRASEVRMSLLELITRLLHRRAALFWLGFEDQCITHFKSMIMGV